jgi:DNA ligase D-like protein (predicted ligase)/DNA ligase D-like protein (predicted 3'-phosphoesterase)
MKQYKPMLARSQETPFSSDEWIFEVKWDGIRAISYVSNELSVRGRNQSELIHNFPELEELKDLTGNSVLDGEIIVMKNGLADFQAVIKRNQSTAPGDIEHLSLEFPVTYVVFDILEKDGSPLLDVPLIERKTILKNSVREGKYVVLSLFVEDKGESYFRAALEKGVEGIMAKKKQSPYEPGKRGNNWLKIRQIKTCDCVIFGYMEGEGSRDKAFGSLILGLYDGKDPVFIGKVGTGFSQQYMEDLKRSMDEYRVDKETLGQVDTDREITWLRPALVCEVGYQTVTEDRRLRIPVFRRLRNDKTPQECTIDQLRPSLKDYAGKRNFTMTPEPAGTEKKEVGKSFVIHEHHARRLHYDLRLEKDGVLKSWAVPKGPPEKSGERRLAVQVEDHPLEYGKFEGTIPQGQYGAGTVKIWDRGFYEPLVWKDDKIELIIKGEKMEGRYVLVKFKKAEKNNWLFFKAGD